MSGLEFSAQPPAEPIGDYPTSQLVQIRQRMEQGHDYADWYLAGEMATHPFYDNKGDRREHDFFVAPNEPQLEAAALNRFTGLMLGYFSKFAVDLWLTAESYPGGDMRLPRAMLASEKVGQRVLETVETVETYVGPAALEAPKVTERVHGSPITEETSVRVFPDPHSAQVVFDYSAMVEEGRLDYSKSVDRYGVEYIAKNEVLRDYQLEALKRWYDGRPSRPRVRMLMETLTM